jgi:hypothetical protein
MKITLSFLLIGALFAAPAFAGKNADACKPDIEKYCKDVKPGGGAMNDCLKQHASELSPACTQFRQTAKDKVDAFTQVCGTDIKTHCGGVHRGGGRIVQCLKQHENALTEACKGQLASSPQ